MKTEYLYEPISLQTQENVCARLSCSPSRLKWVSISDRMRHLRHIQMDRCVLDYQKYNLSKVIIGLTRSPNTIFPRMQRGLATMSTARRSMLAAASSKEIRCLSNCSPLSALLMCHMVVVRFKCMNLKWEKKTKWKQRRVSYIITQVLCGSDLDWIQSGHGHVPSNAISSGRTSSGENLYISRTHYAGSLMVGKVHPSHRCMFFAFGPDERRELEYEVLVQRPRLCMYRDQSTSLISSF